MSLRARVRLWPAFTMAIAGVTIISACSSDRGLADGTSSEVDAASPAALPEAGSFDAASSDASTKPAFDPVVLDCKEAPCYVAVSGNGGQHVCGLLEDGTVRCWGCDTDGALGRGVPLSPTEAATPAPVAGLSDVTQISVGTNLGTCARTSDGSVYCWGRNVFGQLGRPPSEARLSAPTRVEGLPKVDEVRLGHQIACAIASSTRALYCWGRVVSQLEVDAGGASTFEPQIVTSFPAPVKALEIGSVLGAKDDTIITLLDGDVLATVGGILAGSASPLPGPRKVGDVTQIAPFGYRTKDGIFWRWFASTMMSITSDILYLPSLAPIVDVKISYDFYWAHGGALVATGRLFRWGSNATGALGVSPNEILNTPFPVEASQVEGEVISFATTIESTCASLASGKVKCWGSNSFGELGRGSVDGKAHPEAEVIR